MKCSQTLPSVPPYHNTERGIGTVLDDIRNSCRFVRLALVRLELMQLTLIEFIFTLNLVLRCRVWPSVWTVLEMALLCSVRRCFWCRQF